MNIHRLISGIFCLWLSSQTVWAANIVVNTVNDNTIAADKLCTLREAMRNANAISDLTSGDCVAGSGNDVISFSVTGVINLTGDLPEILNVLTITGLASNSSAIEIAGGTNSGFVVTNSSTANLTLKSLSRTGGSATKGGGLLAKTNSTVILENVIFKNNSASEGGAIYLENDAYVTLRSNVILSGNSASNQGGAIFNNDGILFVSDTTFSQNSAFNSGGAIYGALNTTRTFSSLMLSQALFFNNQTMNSSDSQGGAIALTGIGSSTVAGFSIDSVRFYANTATSKGGAMYLAYQGYGIIQDSFIGESGQAENTALYGGGIYNDLVTLIINSSQFVNNHASLQGGAVFNAINAKTTFNSSQLLANRAAIGAAIYNAGTVTLSSSVLGARAQPNIASEQGGGLYNASFAKVTAGSSQFLFNQAIDGAAVYSDATTTTSSVINLKENNCFVGNKSSGGYVVTSMVSNVIDASNAWWGAPSGAESPINQGFGDSANSLVTITPSLTTAPAGCLSANYTSNPSVNSTVDMGSITVGNALISQIQITETGDFALKFKNPVFSGTNAGDFSISAPTLPLILEDGDAAKNLTVQCKPSALGTRTATLKLFSNAVINEYLTLNLQCTGITGSAAVYNSSPIPNSNIRLQNALATPSTANITVSNTGTATLRYSFGTPTTTSGQHTFILPQGSFEIPATGATLSHSISCIPTHVGTDTITLPIISNDTNLPTLGYTISCTGINTTINQAPLDISLSNAGIAENNAPNTVIGIFSTADPDVTDIHTYNLLDSVNGLFRINGNQLIITQTVDYEILNTYKITVQTTDSQGASFSKDFNIVVLDINEQVFNVRGEIRANNTAAATMVLDNPQMFSLVAIVQPDITQIGKKADVNVLFRFIANNTTTPLTVPMTLSQLTLSSPTSITLFTGRLIGLTGVLTVDISYTVEGNTFSTANILTLTLSENRAPTAISLNKTTVQENSANGTIIGTLQITDPDKEELINCGFANVNSKNPFVIRDNSLVVTHGAWLDYETTTQYPLTIRCIDSVGHSIQQSFTINVENVTNEAATQAFYLTRNLVQENSPENTIIGKFETIKKGTGNYQYSLLNDAGGRFKLKDNLLQVADNSLLDFEQAQSYSIEVQQAIGSEKISQTFEIQLTNEVDAGLSGNVFEQNTLNLPNSNSVNPNDLLNSKNFDVVMTLTPDIDDISKIAELFILAVVTPTNSRFFTAFMLTSTGWQEWTGQLNTLQAVATGVLENTHTFTLNTVALPEFNGKISFFAGYRIGTGNLVYNVTPFNLVFHP